MEVPILTAPWQKPKGMEHGGHSLGKYWHHIVFGHVLQCLKVDGRLAVV
jgi:hypothetical protein